MERGSREIQKSNLPLQEMQRRRLISPLAEMDRLFDEVFKRPFFSLLSPRLGSEEGYPPVDVFEDAESVVVKAEIPGMKREEINVQLTADSIILSGQKSAEEKVEQKDYFRLERSYGSFSRSIPLPVEIQMDKARASFKDGVLEIRIPKSEAAADRVRKITVE